MTCLIDFHLKWYSSKLLLLSKSIMCFFYKCFCSFCYLAAGTDFSATSLDFSFQVGTDTTACIDVTIIDDNNLEGDHTFTVNLGGMITPPLTGGTGGTAGFGTAMSTTITIQDPEGTCMSSIPSRISQHSSSTTSFCNKLWFVNSLPSLVPRPSKPQVFDRLQYAEMREKAWGISSHDPRHDCQMLTHLLSKAK